MRVYASLAAADPTDLASAVRALEAAGVDALHLDVEDGVFVPNITFGWATVAAVRRRTRLPLDVHLMVARPQDHVEEAVRVGAQRVAVHVEAWPYPRRAVERLRAAGVRAGLALSAASPLDLLAPALDRVDFVLLMLNEPDGRDQRLIPAMLEKLRRAAALARVHGFELVGDGGIGPDEVAAVVEAGADAVVVGRALFAGGDPGAALTELRARAAAVLGRAAGGLWSSGSTSPAWCRSAGG